jgi:amidophosphoribosyltransferase
VVKPNDNLVIIDDSVVRGTTLKKSIIKILDRLNPKKIVVVSSAPQIRYPDCYGIDMANLEDFIACGKTMLKRGGGFSLILPVERLTEIPGVGEKTAQKLLASAKALLEN